MRIERIRWFLLPVAAAALFAMLWKGATPGRTALFLVCGPAWFALSRLKAYSLDRDRFAGGKLGRRS
jgi:hypothetical protein